MENVQTHRDIKLGTTEKRSTKFNTLFHDENFEQTRDPTNSI